jgi:cytochrome c peroxidase
MHIFLRHISKKNSLEIQNFSLLRNTTFSVLRVTRSITIQLHYPRLESSAFLRYSVSPVSLLFLGLMLLSACSKDPFSPNPASSFEGPDFPAYFPAPHYQSNENSWHPDRIELGRQLFYDPILSSDSSVSCASCHHASHAFSDFGKALSTGVNGAIGSRNSPALFNLLWSTSFMWDGGINHLEIMPFAPITLPAEMNEDMNHVLTKLNRHPQYKPLFDKSFGPGEISSKEFFYVLAQFMGSLVSANSKYDLFRQGKISFSSDEQKGYQLFQVHCNRCHTEPLFTNQGFANNGLDAVFSDEGRYRITLDPADKGKFKIPSLRNIGLSYPYMHNGKFNSLQEVLNHYSSSVKQTETLDPQLNGGIPLNDLEKNQIIQFLHTLTDTAFIQNKSHQNPF